MVEKRIAKGAAIARGTRTPPLPNRNSITINIERIIPRNASILRLNPTREKIKEFLSILNNVILD